MINIVIKTDGKKIFDKFETKNTTLTENSIVLRRIKEIELQLLGMEYQNDIEIDYGGDDEKDM